MGDHLKVTSGWPPYCAPTARTRATRNPVSRVRKFFSPDPRHAAREYLAGKAQLPPRSDRNVPATFTGSVPFATGLPLYESAHHSSTFPSMSWSPNGLACFVAARR